jgi:hypothetical protein
MAKLTDPNRKAETDRKKNSITAILLLVLLQADFAGSF